MLTHQGAEHGTLYLNSQCPTAPRSSNTHEGNTNIVAERFLGLLLGTEAPVMTPISIQFSFCLGGMARNHCAKVQEQPVCYSASSEL